MILAWVDGKGGEVCNRRGPHEPKASAPESNTHPVFFAVNQSKNHFHPIVKYITFCNKVKLSSFSCKKINCMVMLNIFLCKLK